MDDIQKCAIRLKHWIDHNLDHLKGYEEVAETLETQGVTVAAEQIRKGIRLIEDANAAFGSALAELPEQAEHTHEHDHGHSHDHGSIHLGDVDGKPRVVV